MKTTITKDQVKSLYVEPGPMPKNPTIGDLILDQCLISREQFEKMIDKVFPKMVEKAERKAKEND